MELIAVAIKFIEIKETTITLIGTNGIKLRAFALLSLRIGSGSSVPTFLWNKYAIKARKKSDTVTILIIKVCFPKFSCNASKKVEMKSIKERIKTNKGVWLFFLGTSFIAFHLAITDHPRDELLHRNTS